MATVPPNAFGGDTLPEFASIDTSTVDAGPRVSPMTYTIGVACWNPKPDAPLMRKSEADTPETGVANVAVTVVATIDVTDPGDKLSPKDKVTSGV